MEEGCLFCTACGSKLETIHSPQEISIATQSALSRKVLKKFPIKIIALATTIILVVSAVIIVNPFKSKSYSSFSYIKNSEINLTLSSKIMPFQITNKLNDTNKSISADTGFLSSSKLIKYSTDGRYIIYPDKVTADNYSSLYFRDLKADNTKADASIKIDTEIPFNGSFNNTAISSNGKKIFYIKGSDKNLYFHNLTDKERIDTSVDYFYINPDGTMIVYKKENNIYRKEIGSDKEKEKLFSEASLVAVSEDLKKIYAVQAGSLYIKEGDNESQKIASDVETLLANYDNNALYYIKTVNDTVPLSNYVTDDFSESDAAVNKPNLSDFVTVRQSGYFQQTITDWNAYNSAKEKYDAKVARDALRAKLKSEKITITNKSLYYYDGKTETAITDNLGYSSLISKEAPIMIYSKFKQTEISKKKLSEIKSTSDVKTLVEAAKALSPEKYIVMNAVENVISQTRAQAFNFNKSLNALYFIDEYSSENQSGTLMEMSLSGGKPGIPAEIDTDVTSLQFRVDSDAYYYFKNQKNGIGDMYENKKSIATDVLVSKVKSIKGKSDLVYFSDYSSKSQAGTLRIYNGTKAEKIADDVHAFVILSEKYIPYITNYSVAKAAGDAYLYNGSSKAAMIDTDVQVFISK